MLMSSGAKVAAALFAMLATASVAGAAPECLAAGKSYQVGQYACLTVGSAQQLARCDQVLNISSWKTVQVGCPALPPEPSDAGDKPPTPDCLANNQSFHPGQLACLTAGGKSRLARCGYILNNSSWITVQDNCPGDTQPVDSSPAPSPPTRP